ncbi:MAG: flagellar basal body-associated FliL family protein [Treponema sp.]|jgi:flagellar FliL protein|nr:flagellar basal body-associated FliL family protein [Treponema sp.]
MSDSDDLDLDGGDASDSGGSSKKRSGGLGNLLPTILKFVAIGLGALIFIVTVSVITYSIMSKGGKSQTVISDPLSPYIGKRPEYSYYDQIGSMNVKTKDTPISSMVSVEMIIGYDLNNQNSFMELNSRRFELRDFVRRYFTGKTAAELAPEREEELKAEIREQLNTRFLDTARARIILFNKLDVTENF